MKINKLLMLLAALLFALPAVASDDSGSEDEYGHEGGFAPLAMAAGDGDPALDEGDIGQLLHQAFDGGVLVIGEDGALELAPGHEMGEVPGEIQYLVGMVPDDGSDDEAVCLPVEYPDVGLVELSATERAHRSDTGEFFVANMLALKTWADATDGGELRLAAAFDAATPPPCYGKFDDPESADAAVCARNEARRQRFLLHVMDDNFDGALAVIQEADPVAVVTAEHLAETFTISDEDLEQYQNQGYVSVRGIHHLVRVMVPEGGALPPEVVHDVVGEEAAGPVVAAEGGGAIPE